MADEGLIEWAGKQPDSCAPLQPCPPPALALLGVKTRIHTICPVR